MCHKTRMNRAVGRCSARMRQVPAKCFFFHSILESNGRDNRLYKEAKPPRPPRTGRGQSFVLLAPLSHLLSASPALLCMRSVDLSCLVVLPCLALPCLALFFLSLFAAANTPAPHTEAALPSCPPNFKFVHLCAAPTPGRRANAAPSSVDFAQRSKQQQPPAIPAAPVVAFHAQPAAETGLLAGR